MQLILTFSSSRDWLLVIWLAAKWFLTVAFLSSSSAIDLVRRKKASVFYLTDIMQKTSRARTPATFSARTHTDTVSRLICWA